MGLLVSTVARSVDQATSYVPLRCHSYYWFLDSTLSPTAIVQVAKTHDLPAVALTDSQPEPDESRPPVFAY